MNAEILLDNFEEENEKDKLKVSTILLESERLTRLINNVLNFRSREKGMLKVHKVEVKMSKLVRESIEKLEMGLLRSGLEVEFNVLSDANVKVDRDILFQILSNLLSNIEKYAADGKKIEIELTVLEDVTTISVRDYGKGVSGKDRVRIFNPFYRISDSITEGVSGAGIGLSISRELARLHGGDLTLDSSSSRQGARFVFNLNTPQVNSDGEL